MALPSRPNARLGLPSNPRSRSAARADLPSRPGSAASMRTRAPAPSSAPSLRSQRSLVDLPSARQDARPPVPELPVQHRYGRQGSVGSVDSSSSSSDGSGATSVTSYEDDEEMDKEPAMVAPGFGSSLWSRVAAAAGSLSINVSKAWEGNIAGASGEMTPPGKESRLTRAMKAYHIAKAQSPADLPEWLFDDRDRGVTSRVRVEETAIAADSGARTAEPQTQQSQPFRVRDIVITDTKPRAPEPDVPLSRAAQRLKEMTEAKRNPRVKFAEAAHPRHAGATATTTVSEQAIEREVQPAPVVDVPLQRRPTQAFPRVDLKGRQPMGLPSGVRLQRA